MLLSTVLFFLLSTKRANCRGKKQRERTVRQYCLALLVLVFATLNGGCAGLVSGTNGGALATPSVATEPTDQTVTVGQTATFSVVAAGSAPLNYQWNKNGTAITSATSASYTTPATIASDDGAQFTALISNKVGRVTSNPVSLHVKVRVAPSITTQPANQTVTAGQTATFTVLASGMAPLSYQWLKNGANVAGATSSSYTTPLTTTADGGSTFNVVVSNTAGTATSNAATLTVNAASVQPR